MEILYIVFSIPNFYVSIELLFQLLPSKELTIYTGYAVLIPMLTFNTHWLVFLHLAFLL
jgi:hypothetical protein